MKNTGIGLSRQTAVPTAGCLWNPAPLPAPSWADRHLTTVAVKMKAQLCPFWQTRFHSGLWLIEILSLSDWIYYYRCLKETRLNDQIFFLAFPDLWIHCKASSSDWQHLLYRTVCAAFFRHKASVIHIKQTSTFMNKNVPKIINTVKTVDVLTNMTCFKAFVCIT